VLFANTDMPLMHDEITKNDLVQFPQVIISITPVVHLAGIKAGEIVLDGPTLAGIYLGNITQWDDPAIKKLNPKVSLPHQAITTVHRSDGSGTTFNFIDYLSKVSPDWKSKVGEGTAVTGRMELAARAIPALRPTCSRSTVPSDMSNMPTL
jgi:phosphate transport system substrate-binding protein